MRKIRLLCLVTSFALLALCSSGSLPQDAFDYCLNTGSQTYNFVTQPQYGYVVKSSNDKRLLMGLQSYSRQAQGNVE
jgi:hypothetical protein